MAVSWIYTLVDLADSSDTVRIALDAVAFTIVGHSNSDHALLQEGTRLYGRALSATNVALQDRTTAQDDAVLASCKALAMYENYRPSGEGGISSKGFDWHHHVDGTCRIVQLRGPARHVADHGHILFEELRIMAAISSITRKQANVFTSNSWYTIPWETSPRNLCDELVDIMIALPDILAQQSVLTAQLSHAKSYQSQFDVLTASQNLMNRCILTGQSLLGWEAKALQLSSEALPTSRSEFLQTRTLSGVCVSHGYGFLNTTMKYWTSCLLLYSTTWILHRSVTAAIRPDDCPSLPAWAQLPPIPAWMNPDQAASNIALNVHHYYAESAGYWSVAASLFPIGAACHYYAATRRWQCSEMGYIRELFQSKKLGQLTKDFLSSIANTTGAAKGDSANREELARMASSWFGADSAGKEQR